MWLGHTCCSVRLSVGAWVASACGLACSVSRKPPWKGGAGGSPWEASGTLLVDQRPHLRQRAGSACQTQSPPASGARTAGSAGSVSAPPAGLESRFRSKSSYLRFSCESRIRSYLREVGPPRGRVPGGSAAGLRDTADAASDRGAGRQPGPWRPPGERAHVGGGHAGSGGVRTGGGRHGPEAPGREVQRLLLRQGRRGRQPALHARRLVLLPGGLRALDPGAPAPAEPPARAGWGGVGWGGGSAPGPWSLRRPENLRFRHVPRCTAAAQGPHR